MPRSSEVLQSSDMNVTSSPPPSSTVGWTPWLADFPTPFAFGAFGWIFRWTNFVSVRSPLKSGSTWSVQATWAGQKLLNPLGLMWNLT
jgi:hypothetical protein